MTKMTRQMWIEAGLDTLRERGHADLKAEALAKRMGVTRGSFYGYFKNLSAYHDAIFDAWLEQSQSIIATFPLDAQAEEKLEFLIRAAADSDTRLEQAIRAWAHAEPEIAEKVAPVDAFRIKALEQILSEATGASSAPERAFIVYAVAVGQIALSKDLNPSMEAVTSKLKAWALKG